MLSISDSPNDRDLAKTTLCCALSLAALLLWAGDARAATEDEGAQKETPVRAAAPSAWWTGPLLASPGHTIPQGHAVFAPYVFASHTYGAYDDPWTYGAYDSAHRSNSLGSSLNLSVGLLDRVDAGLSVQGNYREKDAQSSIGVGDTTVRLGFQAVEARDGRWIPDVMLVAKATVPSGRYANLNPERLSTDAKGSGSFTTTLGLNLQKVILLPNQHPLRLRLNTSYAMRSSVHVSEFHSYGGGYGADGTVYPGDSIDTILAAEYHLTPHWVVAFDVMHNHTTRDTFVGNPGTSRSGAPASAGGPARDQVSVAPALEYNFNGNIGIIAGVWATVVGRNDSAFVTPVLAMNTYF